MILVDSNILLRIAQLEHKHRPVCLDAIALLRRRDNERFASAPQSLYEMYVVCSRPTKVNGLGMTPERALSELSDAKILFPPVLESPRVYSVWESLVAKYAFAGKRAHDLRLVAVMLESRIPRLLTLNDSDFKPVSEIEVINPFDVLNLSRA